METKTFDELFALLRENKLAQLRSRLCEMNVVDIAEFLEENEPERMMLIFRILPKDISADVFSYLDSDNQTHIVNAATDKELTSLVDDLYLDDAVDFLEEVPANVVKRVLAHTDSQTRALINTFLQYPDNSAGSIMTIEMVELHDRLTVDEKYIGPEADTKLEFLFDSAMAQAMQAYTKSNAANVTIEALAAFMNLGVTSVIDNFDTDNMIRDVSYSGGAPSSYFVPRNRMEDSRAERRRAAEEQLELENRVKESEIARNNAGASNLNNSGGFNGGAE